MFRQDGSIQSANLPTRNSLQRLAINTSSKIYRCMITEVFFVDDERNLTFDNKQVTYEAIILGGREEGQVITNIKTMNWLGGQYNYQERIFRKTYSPFSGAGKKGLPEQTGDIVYITFINEDRSLPVIIGCGVHPLDKDTTGATKADGHIFREQYNGINRSIDKDGNFSIKRFGGEWQSDERYFKPNEQVESEVSFTEKSITIKVTDAGEVTVNNNGISMSSLSEVLINAAAAFKAIADGEVEISGSAVSITSSGTAELIGDGGTTVGSSGGATTVDGASVSLGGGGAPVARLGDSALGIGVYGVPVNSTIINGSGITNSA